MTIFLDENLPPALAEGFNVLQQPENFRLQLADPIEVKSIKKVFGKGVADEYWIPQVGVLGACSFTQDFNIHRIAHQRRLCIKYNLGMIYLRPPSKTGYSYWEMVQLMVKHWHEIIQIVSKEERPFFYQITPRASKLERLK